MLSRIVITAALILMLGNLLLPAAAQEEFIQNWEADWSPDGSKIAFSSNRDGDYDIWIMDADGQNQINLTSAMPGNQRFPVWSPAGETILFESEEAGSKTSLWIMQANGEGMTRITAKNRTSYIAQFGWSPDGTLIAFVESLPEENPALWIFQIDGPTLYQVQKDVPSNVQFLWFANDVVANITFADTTIPVNETYSLVVVEQPYTIQVCRSSNLYLRSIGGGSGFDVYSITDPVLMYSYRIGTYVSWATLSCTDRPRVAFIIRENEIHYLRIFDTITGDVITILPPDSSRLVNAYEAPQWSPDGTQLLLEWHEDRYTGQDLWLINPDGTHIRNLTCDNTDYACVR
jgi:dipeptidyl aminopeptidase/acylaminoacyl peptidase